LKVSRLNFDPRPCPDCRQPVPLHAKVCPNCKAYRNWRRYITVGQTNLALLVALFSVITTLATIGVPMLRTKGSDISVLLDSASADQAVFIARNDGRSGGVLHMARFVIKIKKRAGFEIFYPLNDKERSFIDAGKEQRIQINYVNNDYDDSICQYLFDQKFFDDFGKITSLNANYDNPPGVHINDRYGRMNDALLCTIVGGQKSFFNEPGSLNEDNIIITPSCSDIQWIKSCLVRANSSFIE
jgi:hypothetical protein